MKYWVWDRPSLYESSVKTLENRGIFADPDDPDIIFIHTKPFSGKSYSGAKWVVSNTTDTSHIDVREDVEVVSLQGLDLTDVHSAAEHAIYLAMSVMKRNRTRDGEPNGDMWGVKYDILGFGRIAAHIEIMMEAFNGRGVFSSADPMILFVALPATDESIHAVDESVLRKLVPGSIVVNISRGSVIKNSAMIWAMDRGIHYATDFPLSVNPALPGSPLDGLEERMCFETDHVGGYTHQGLAKTEALVIDELLKRIDQKAALVSN